MSDDLGGPPPVASSEALARFVVQRHWIRHDGTVKQDAFMPPRDLELSVTRHLGLTEDQLWGFGEQVAAELSAHRLLGRADVTVEVVHRNNLNVVPVPLPNNPNHAHLIGWPADKPLQKMIAQELAAASRFTRQ
jgi:hypothetical protein